MFRSLTIIRELYLCRTKVIFMLKQSVKLRRYIYIYILGDVTACRRAACVLCAVCTTHMLLYVVVCNLETSWMRRPWPTGGCRAKSKQKKLHELDEDSYYINMFPLAAFFLDVNNASIKRNTNSLLPLPQFATAQHIGIIPIFLYTFFWHYTAHTV